MNRSRLLLGISAVFAGLFVLMAVLGFVRHVAFLVIAIPFGIVSYTLWYHASGRLRARVIRQHEANRARARREPNTGGFGAGPREGFRNGTTNSGGFGGSRAGASARGDRTRRRSRERSGLSAAEAYNVLGLDPGADPDQIRRTYREKVKAVHPDAENGDEASFKRVQRAYERLRNGHDR